MSADLALLEEMSSAVLGLTETHAKSFVLIQQFLDGVSLVSEVNAQLFALARQGLHILSKLIAIKRELPELFVLVGEALVVVLDLFDLILGGGDHVDVPLQDALQVAFLIICSRLHHTFEALHHALPMIVAAESKCQLLTLAIVVEQLLVLVADVGDHILVLLSAISEDLQSFGCLHGAGHELRPGPLLQNVLLVTEMELPFVEAVTEVGLLVLLAISDELEPVADDFPELDESDPSIKHLRLEVVIGTVPVLPAANRLIH